MKTVHLPEPIQRFLREQDIYLLADYQVKVERPVRLQQKSLHRWGFSFWTSKPNRLLYTIAMSDTGEVIVVESDGHFKSIRLLANFFKGSFEEQLAIC